MSVKTMTVSEVIEFLAEECDFEKAHVKELLQTLAALAHQQCMVKGAASKRGPGAFVIPYMGAKFENKMQPKRAARMGRNPATGEEIKIAAKPASLKMKARVLSKFHIGCGNKKA